MGDLNYGVRSNGMTIAIRGDELQSDERPDLLRELRWIGHDLEVLSDEQLLTIARSVREEMRATRRSHQRASGYVRKERRLGATNRMGWRWVIYVRRDGEAVEVGQDGTQHLARQQLRRKLAIEEFELRRFDAGSTTALTMLRAEISGQPHAEVSP